MDRCQHPVGYGLTKRKLGGAVSLGPRPAWHRRVSTRPWNDISRSKDDPVSSAQTPRMDEGTQVGSVDQLTPTMPARGLVGRDPEGLGNRYRQHWTHTYIENGAQDAWGRTAKVD